MTSSFHKKPNMYTSHVQLKVSNLTQSIEYYTAIIGFHVLSQTKDTAYLTVDGKSSLVSLVEVPNATPIERGVTGLYHLALLLPSHQDLGNIIQHFIEQNVRIGAGDHHVSEALYLNDPDGNGIEIYADRDAREWIWDERGHVYMTTEQVHFQPLLALADGTWNGLPEGTVMGHIHLSVADLAETEAFYTNILDYEVVTRYGRQALFISTGKYHHHIGLNTWSSAGGTKPTARMIGLKSYTVVLKDVSHAQQVKDSLTKHNYPVELFTEAPAYGGEQSFSTIDPNGLRIVFTVDGE